MGEGERKGEEEEVVVVVVVLRDQDAVGYSLLFFCDR